MTDMLVITALKDFLEQNVSPEIFLKKPRESDINEFDWVNPSVYIAYLPPDHLLPQSMNNTVPCILVGMEKGEDAISGASISIKLIFTVFNPGNSTTEDPQSIFDGYIDLLNLMTLTKIKLLEKHCIGDIASINRPINWGIYGEPPYPHWYGFMTFSVLIASIEYNSDIESQYE